jgi:hypothetical protein
MIHDVADDSVPYALSRRFWLACLLIAAGLMAVPDLAQAQNLVQDPNFTNGFNAYTNVCCNVTTMPGEKGAVAVLPAGSTISQIIPTSAETMYIVSFMASFTGPGFYTASFGDVTYQEDYTKPGLFSFTAPAFGSNTTLTIATNSDSSTEYLSNLDVQAEGAPAPTPGTGILSFCALVAAVAIHRRRGALRSRTAHIAP